MARIVYLGDEATVAGLRLAGLDARTVAPGDAGDQLREALTSMPDCVLLDGALAECVPVALLEAALAADTPLFSLVPDVRGRGAPADLARVVRNALGIEA